MKIYVLGDKPRAQRVFIMAVAPAATLREEVPSDWVDEKNNPVQFNVEFNHGVAEVEDRLGRYLVENGLAARTRLILPSQIQEEG